jgi:transketolase C-terminal domain/subunit
MSHHSAQDIAAMSAIPNMRVYLPSDRFQTAELVKALLQDQKPAYIRVCRNASEDIYEEHRVPFEMNKAAVLAQGTDVLLVACGEMVKPSLDAVELLKKRRDQRRTSGHVLCEAAGSGNADSRSKKSGSGCYSRGTFPVRRDWAPW